MQWKITQQNNQGFNRTPIFLQSILGKCIALLSVVVLSIFDSGDRRKQSLQHKNWCRGFTLVEMLVSLSLFTVVLTMSVGTLLVLIDANGRAQSMQLIMTNFSFAIDSMTREMRTGTDWYCIAVSGSGPSIPTLNVNSTSATRDCTSLTSTSDKMISFIETGGSLTEGLPSAGTRNSSRISYRFDNDYYSGGRGAVLRKLGMGSDSTQWVPLTGPEIDIDVFDVYVSGTSRMRLVPSDTTQPTMTLYIRGTAGTDAQRKEFSLQTSITQRQLDL